MKTAASAIAIIAALALSPTAARAACEVKHGTAANVLTNHPTGSHLETDCASTSTVNTDNAAQDAVTATKADTSYVDSENAAQDGIIVTKADTTYVDAQNGAQDTVIATKASTAYVDGQNAAQDTVIATKVDKTRLDSFNGTGGSLETWADGVDGTNAAQTAMLSQHSGQIAVLEGGVSKLFKKSEQAFEGVAMALAMESPQVDPGKRFGISLNYGGFEGENALAAAAKLRFDDTWAGTAGVGYGMGQKTLGVRAGIQAQW